MKTKKKLIFSVILLIEFMHVHQASYAQNLGPTAGNFLEINSISGHSANNFYNKSWLVRDAPGSDWLTARLHDGIDIDGAYPTPMLNTKTWWERDPYNNVQSWGNADQTYLTIANGRIGIGTQAPVTKLQIVESSANGWIISSKAIAVETGQINGLKFISGYPNDTNKWAGVASVAENQHSNSTGLALYAGANERLRINSNGNVGIGVITAAEKLAVNGTIRAKEVKVETANWPDYVFNDHYKLPDLEATANYIKVNKHLPGMPSAAEAEENGISLGEMNRKLLEKVEELTLYLIEKEKTEQLQNERILNLERKQKN